MKRRGRYLIIDLIRGVAVINMVLYHLLYDLVYMFGVNVPFFSMSSYYTYLWQQGICMTFIVVAGISLNFNSKKLNHILKLALVAISITGATYVFMRDFVIYFGIIHFLALGIFIIYLLEKWLKRLNSLIGSGLILMIFYIYRSDFFKNSRFFQEIYSILSPLPLSFVLGFPNSDFYSADYFPLIPWIFMLIFGYYLGKMVKFESISNIRSENIFVLIGQNSLVIYILHQVVIYVGLNILTKFI